MGPNLFLVGAPRAGTTTLFHQLGRADEVFVPRLKEPNFLSPAIVGGRLNGPVADVLRRMSAFEQGEYQALYRAGGRVRWRLDGSTSYFADPEGARSVRDYQPDARIIIVLREPAARAASAFAYMRRDGLEPAADLATALREESARRASGWPPIYWYRDTGRYAEHVGRFFEAFGRERVRVVLQDDLRDDFVGVMQDLSAFLQVDLHREKLDTPLNESGVPRSLVAHRLLNRPTRLRAAVRQVAPAWLHQAVVRVRAANLNAPAPIAEHQLAELRASYANDVLRTAELVERPDLPARWNVT